MSNLLKAVKASMVLEGVKTQKDLARRIGKQNYPLINGLKNETTIVRTVLAIADELNVDVIFKHRETGIEFIINSEK